MPLANAGMRGSGAVHVRAAWVWRARQQETRTASCGASVSEPCNMHPATLVPRRAHRVWVAVSAQFIGSGRIPIRAERYVLELICKLKSSVAAGVDLYLTNSCTRGLY